MTRTLVYSLALVAAVAATAMTLTSIATPRWVSYAAPSHAGGTVTDTIGLHRRCTSAAGGTCSPFPGEARCGRVGGVGGDYDDNDDDDGRAFCSMWRTAGFLMNFAAGAELAALVGFLVVLAGGRAKRQDGWKVLVGLLGAVAVAEVLGLAVVAYLFDHDELFLVPGYRLDSSWYLCASSAAVSLLAGLGLAVSAFVLPPEDGYQLLGEPSGV